MATQQEYDALQDAERRLLREEAGMRGRMEAARDRITRLTYEGKLEGDTEVQAAQVDLDALQVRADQLPADLLAARRDRLAALETLLPPTDHERRQRIRDFQEAVRKHGTGALNPAIAGGDLKRSGLAVTA